MNIQLLKTHFLTSPDPEARVVISAVKTPDELELLSQNIIAKRIFVFSFQEKLPAFLSSHPLTGKVILPVHIPPTLLPEKAYELAFKALEPYFEFFAEGKVSINWHKEVYTQYNKLCKAIEDAALHYTRVCLSSVGVRALRGWHHLLNSCLNLQKKFYSFNELKGCLKNSGAVLVGAGPSLDKSYELLKHLQSKMTLIACDGALPSLYRANIMPDLIISVDDTEKVWRYFAPLKDAEELLTLMVPESCWALQRYCKGKFLMAQTSKSYNNFLLDEALHNNLPTLNTGLCVGHSALNTALFMGASKIIMVAFDLGYDETGSFHPADMPVPYFHITPPPESNITYVQGNDGKTVKTDLSMFAYLREFERLIEEAKIPVWNATAGGALIKGTHRPAQSDLDELLAHSSKVKLNEIIANSHLVTTNTSHAKNILTKSSKFVSSLNEMLQNSSWQSKLLSSNYPFEFLSDYKDIVDAMSDSENPLPVIEFNFAFEEWQKGKRDVSSQKLLLEKAENILLSLLSSSMLIENAMQLPVTNNSQSSPFKITAASRKPDAFKGWETLFSALSQSAEITLSHIKVDAFIPDFWRKIIKNPQHLVICDENALMPSAWGVAGLACMEIKESIPDRLANESIIIEQWLPGYAILTMNEKVANHWRQLVPSDIPICLWQNQKLFISNKEGEKEAISFKNFFGKLITKSL
jgi:hypothetical protein